MDERLKILPMVALGALVLLAVKGMDLWTDIKRELSAVSTAHAGAKAEETDREVPEAHDEHKNDADHGGDELSGEKHDGGPDGEHPMEEAVDTTEADLIHDPALMTKSEVEVLQSLSDRREELNNRARDLDMQAKLLQAAEKRIAGRIAELKALEQKVETMFAEKEERDQAKKEAMTAEREKQIASLVKVYESMKAKDAARIFNRLDDTILVQVAKRMREAKVAAILARMDPASAQKLTVLLAAQPEEPAARPGG